MPEPSAKPDRRQLGQAFIWEWGRRRSEEERKGLVVPRDAHRRGLPAQGANT